MKLNEQRTNKTSSLGELLYPDKKTTESCELTEEEKEAVLAEALRRKQEAQKYDDDMRRRREWEATIRRPWTAEEMKKFLIWRAVKNGVMFKLDSDNEKVFKILCMYFTSDSRFEAQGDGFSLKKGIMLCGSVGRGKTTLMGVFRANQRRSYRLVSCRELADRFASEGHEMLHMWSRPLPHPNSIDTLFQTEIGVCFDDLGTEGSKKNYGNSVNVMENIILNRYDMGVLPWYYTHLTTNLSGDEIEEYYGTRARSRMREMFNMLTLSGEDRRK